MNDPDGRQIGYLRLSLTEACQMRCAYCRPGRLRPGGRSNQLTTREIESVVRHLVTQHGVHKVRLTGGDPTARPDLAEIIERIAAIDGVRDLALTTNGLVLDRYAADYRRAGLHRVNISLDSLDPDVFQQITGVDGLERVLGGIDAAVEAGLRPIRLNTVVLAGENDAELPDLVRFAAVRGLEIRFIELMPMGPLQDRWAERYVPEWQMRRRIDPVAEHWRPLLAGHSSARRYGLRMDEGQLATVGFISPMSCGFCAACNRLRLAADGTIYPCLMDRPRGSMLPALRPVFDGAFLDRLLQEALAAKAPRHPAAGMAVMAAVGG